MYLDREYSIFDHQNDDAHRGYHKFRNDGHRDNASCSSSVDNAYIAAHAGNGIVVDEVA